MKPPSVAGKDRRDVPEHRAHILLVALSFGIPYEVMRCAGLANMSVHVLAAEGASGLRFSRHCKSFHRFASAPGCASLEETAAEIIETARRVGAHAVLPCDIVSTRLFSLIADLLPVPTCPLPSPAVFDAVNDKWRFYELCRDAGLPTPETWLIEDVAKLEQSLRDGTIPMPAIVKPLNLSGGAGIRIVKDQADIRQLRQIPYRPLIVQRFFAGSEGGINMLCVEGKVTAFVYQKHQSDRLIYSAPDAMLALAQRLAKATHYQGVAHIDTIENAETGQTFLIDFNPRFWSSIAALALADANFVKFSIDGTRRGTNAASIASGRTAVLGKTLFKRLFAADRIYDKERLVSSRRNFDPAIMFGQRFGLFEDFTQSPGDSTLPRGIRDEAATTAMLAPDKSASFRADYPGDA